MTASSKLILNKFGQLVVLVMLPISIVVWSQKEAIAIPLEPVLDQVGRCVVERTLGTDSAQVASPDSQAESTTPASPEDLAESDVQQSSPTPAPTEVSAPTPDNSTQEQPTLNQAAPQPTCPPTILPNPQLPMNITPAYPAPQAYPPYPYISPPSNRTPVIINNF